MLRIKTRLWIIGMIKFNDINVSHVELLHMLTYEPDTGDFYWKNHPSRPKFKLGKKATFSGLRYLAIWIKSKQYPAHRVAWFYMTGEWPNSEIDHKDRNGFNNAFENLRLADRSKNCSNRAGKDGGYKGVRLDDGPKGARYSAHLKSKDKRLVKCGFYTKNAAALAYNRMAIQEFGEFAFLNDLPYSEQEIEQIEQDTKMILNKKTSKYVGVYWKKRNKKWSVSVGKVENGKYRSIYIGLFDSELEASEAYEKAVIDHGVWDSRKMSKKDHDALKKTELIKNVSKVEDRKVRKQSNTIRKYDNE